MIIQKIINIPKEVKISVVDGALKFEKDKNLLQVQILSGVKAEIKENELLLGIESSVKQFKANLGTTRALAQNAINGLVTGFTKNLEIEGIGFRATKEGEGLTFSLGFSHPIKFTPPNGIKLEVEKNKIKVSGFDKAIVGQVAAEIRALRKPEPYKGKGIRYEGEVIRRKAGKKVATSA